MLKQALGVLVCGLALTACSSLLDYTVGIVMGPEKPPSADPAPQPLPNVKQIVANSSDVIFDPSANPNNIVIGTGIRQIAAAGESEFGACLRASTSNRAGKDMGTVTYVVTVANNRISDRRRAVPADGCEKEQYEPLK